MLSQTDTTTGNINGVVSLGAAEGSEPFGRCAALTQSCSEAWCVSLSEWWLQAYAGGWQKPIGRGRTKRFSRGKTML
jgi:hypothetical protein